MTLGRCPLSIFCSRGTPPRQVPRGSHSPSSHLPCPQIKTSTLDARGLKPLGGVRGLRCCRFGGCYVTKLAPHNALKSIAYGKLTFDERVAHHRVATETWIAAISLAGIHPGDNLVANRTFSSQPPYDCVRVQLYGGCLKKVLLCL